MFKLDIDLINKKENELIYFDDFIPFDICSYIDMLKRNNYLKNRGKFDKIQKKNFSIRQNMKNSDDADLFSEKILKLWVVENPQFADLIVFE